MTKFTDLALIKPLLKALAEEGYDTPTPIQAQAIPAALAGRDILGIAQTGTGKTAAFALPILQRLEQDRKPAPRRGCRALILAPTRELATQIGESFRVYGRHLGFTVAVVFGGVKYGAQVKALAAGVDILVATPGRLIDHMQEKVAVLSGVEIFVLDEADQMLDLGFLPPIKRIIGAIPKQRQTLFFSATMPTEIGKLVADLLKDPAKVSVAPQATTVERIRQQVLFVESERKRALLAELLSDPKMTRTLVFTRTKRGADRVAQYLEHQGIDAQAIHGDKSQGQRERALAAFKSGQVRALVATDIAARGIDVDAVSHVVQVDLPNVPESYVHRIGRTARAGADGSAIALVSNDERGLLKDIEKLTRQSIPAFDRRNDKGLGALVAVEPKPAFAPRTDSRAKPRGGGKPKSHAGGRSNGQGGGNQRSRKPQGPRPSAPRGSVASTRPISQPGA